MHGNIQIETHITNAGSQQTGMLQCAEQLISISNKSDLAFDDTSTPAALDDDSYSHPQDASMMVPAADSPSPYCTAVTEHYYVNFVQPADSLVLLFNQIKQTNVRDISRSSIK